MLLLIKYTLLYGMVLLLVALGGMYSERSGVINIALEGIMAVGGLAGILTLVILPATMHPALIVLITVLASAVVGGVFSLLLAYSAITLKADQTIGGTALNMMAVAIGVVTVKLYNGDGSSKLKYSNEAFIYDYYLPNGQRLTINVFFYIGIVILLVAWFFMFKTKWGLRLRSCGEHPSAADSVGIDVYKWRYVGVIVSGILGGIGGFAYIVPSVSVWNFEVGVTGFGFLALAVMIFGQWKPFKICGAALFFAIFKALANIADSTVLANLDLSKNIYDMMPFAASMIILVLFSKNSRAPKAEGIPYDRNGMGAR